jgi:hypothetical protein
LHSIYPTNQDRTNEQTNKHDESTKKASQEFTERGTNQSYGCRNNSSNKRNRIAPSRSNSFGHFDETDGKEYVQTQTQKSFAIG